MIAGMGESGDVCIAFSARDTPEGKFTFFKMLSEFGGRVIFVNDYSNGWYLDGTPDFDGERHFQEWLSERVATLKSPTGRVFTVGTSMGAYAALKYGSMLEAQRVLAMGPETELCVPLGRSVSSLKGVAEGAGDISRIAFACPQDVLVLSGANDLVDVFCACKLHANNPAVQIWLMRNTTHVVAKALDAQFGLKDILCRFLEYGDRSFLEHCDLIAPIDLNTALTIKMFNESLVKRKVVLVDAFDVLRACAQRVPAWSMIQYFCALCAESLGDPEAAERFLFLALDAQPALGRARLKLAQLMYSEQRHFECVKLLQALPQDGYTTNIRLLLADAREALGDASGAVLDLKAIDPASLEQQRREELVTRIKRLEIVSLMRHEADSLSHVLSHDGFRPGRRFFVGHSTFRLDGSSAQFLCGDRCTFEGTEIIVGRAAKLSIGDDCTIRGRIVVQDDSEVSIGNGVVFDEPVSIRSGDARHVVVGDDCSFAGVHISSADDYVLHDKMRTSRLNPPGDVRIGNRVRVDHGAVFRPGSRVSHNCVIAASTVVQGEFDECNVFLSGNPAQVLMRDIDWDDARVAHGHAALPEE
ncbi:hypothetical protein [Caballeronia sp. INDeC2]|uniref:hypothetical protein n=1 Tax=Caballeronia sp. INDeC2 TaxID=2921747 RepID=UPI00202837A4|nr:hypothetical protein [Caballeronia sp. INDeC2]